MHVPSIGESCGHKQAKGILQRHCRMHENASILGSPLSLWSLATMEDMSVKVESIPKLEAARMCDLFVSFQCLPLYHSGAHDSQYWLQSWSAPSMTQAVTKEEGWPCSMMAWHSWVNRLPSRTITRRKVTLCLQLRLWSCSSCC